MTPTLALDGELLKRLERLAFVSRRRVASYGKGDRRSVHKGSSIEFVDYRHYTPGDELRTVDWNIYRRSGQLYVKQFEEEEVLTGHVLLDLSRSMEWGTPSKAELAAKLAVAIGYIMLASASRLMVATLGAPSADRFGPSWGRPQLAGLMSFVERQRAAAAVQYASPSTDTAPTDLDSGLEEYARRATPGTAVIISDLLTPTFEAGVRRLLDRRFEVIVLHVLAPEEVSPEMSGDLTLIDVETRREVAITLNQEAIDRYQARFRQWTTALENFCGRHGVTYQRIQSSERLESVLFDRLRRRGVLR
jgi:uncharacterized protein (DUF58 family)